MASTYSSNLKIELMGTGENAGTWGNITNTNLGTAYEQAVIGLGNPDYTSDANLTITLTDSNAAQAARALVLNVTSVFGSLTQTRELIVPTIQKQYIVQNNTTGGQSITVKTSGGTGITVPNGRKAHLYVDGTNVIQMFDFVDINGGTIDGATVGAASASTGAFTSLTASGATTLNGAVALGDASGDLITVPGTVNSNLLFTDATYDIGASGATRPRDLFLSRNLTVGGTLTLAGGVNLNGNVTVGDSSADTLTINSTITSNLIFTDNTYDIGASGATRPRSLFLAGNITAAGNQTLTGALTVDSTTDSSSTTTGSIQTDGGVGIAKALFVGTTANIAGAVTLTGGTANGVLYLNGSKVATSGSALTYDGVVEFKNINTTESAVTAQENGTGFYTQLYTNTSTSILIAGKQGGGATQPLAFYTNGAEQMRLNSTGLGIGTNNPVAKLDVQATTGTFRLASSTGTNAAYLYATNTGGDFYFGRDNSTGATFSTGSAYSAVLYSAGAYPMVFFTNAAEKMRLDASGNLGIGTNNPQNTLDVRGGATVATSTGAGTVTIGTSSGRAQYQYVALGGQVGGTDYGWQVGRSSQGGVVPDGFYIYDIKGNATRLVIDLSGNVGIGTTGPNAKLTVWTPSTTGLQTALRLNNPFGFDNVNTGAQIVFSQDRTTAEDIPQGIIAVGQGNAGTSAESFMAFYTNSTGVTEKARITSVGRLLVGTTSTGTGAKIYAGGGGGFYMEQAGNGGTGSPYQDRGYLYGPNDVNVFAGIRFTNEYLGNVNTGMQFWVTNGAVGSATEAGRFIPTGYFKASNTATYADAAGLYHEFRGNSANSYVVIVGCTNATPLSEYIQDWRFTAASPNDGNARFWNCEDSTANRGYMRSNGGLSNYQANDTNLSDRREKTNFAPAGSYLDKICAIPVQTFNYIDQNFETDDGLTLGVVAQDVQAVAPELVSESNWGTKEEPKMRLSIYQTDLQYALMKCIQEQQAIIESLKARLDAANL
jgi:hypothetical protein